MWGSKITVEYRDGDSQAFSGRPVVKDGALLIRRWFKTVAVIPLSGVKKATAAAPRKVTQTDFEQGPM